MGRKKSLFNFKTVVENYSKSPNRVYSSSSPEPFDGNFIERDPRDSFSSEGCVRYGEETDVDDI